MSNSVESPNAELPRVLAERYRLEELLGRGGMACVYRATDLASGRVLALKLLTEAVSPDAREHVRVAAALFEREFHTLVQLRHPRVIAVYEYGLSADQRPYYTMELLDGGDLRDRAPLPWRDVCRLMFEVCSSLALLHSRRLLHRDISPRNIRCTRDGTAKLIDFGAMATMTAGGAEVVGTPSFIAPETLHRLALDARTDLFSLGATCYFALTGQLAYSGRSFADVMAAWNSPVAPPSTFQPNIPAALDDLVLALIKLEPALRPQSAFEVMQRVAACAGLPASESDAVPRAYLATPLLFGREAARDSARRKLLNLQRVPSRGLLLRGSAGVGRSRLLDVCALDAKTLGFVVLRATASNNREAFACAQALIKHLLDALPAAAEHDAFQFLSAAPMRGAVNEENAEPEAGRPALRNFADPSCDAEQLQNAICRLLQTVSRTSQLLIAVDDVHRIDQPSAAVLGALLDQAARGRIALALTFNSDEAASDAVNALSRRCDDLAIEPLTRGQTEQLLGSLFGDVAHLPMLADEIYQVARGNPRQCLDMAQHLVDRGLIRYAAGSWSLPERLHSDDLPESATEALRVRIERLSPHARWLAEAQALAFEETFSDQDYRALAPELGSQSVEAAVSELLASQAIRWDGSKYALSHRLWTGALLARLDAGEVQARHAALARFYEQRSKLAHIHHLFSAGMHEQGLDAMIAQHATYERGFDHRLEPNLGKLMWCRELALETALRLGRSPRQIHDLRRWHLAGSIAQEQGVWNESARLWFEQLAHDSGLDLYRGDSENQSPMERLTRALQGAQQRFLATPEHERVYPVDQAIRLLAEYVVFCIALGGRTHDAALLQSLPAILEPFAVLSPALTVIWKNARATYLANCSHYESARELWIEVSAQLDAMSSNEMPHIEAIRNAVAFAIGLMEARLGLASATRWAARMERDPFQKIAALNLRRIVYLEQGDWESADLMRREAELSSLRMRSPQMFRSMLAVELSACARASDIAGLQQAIEAVKPLAAYPGWLPYLVAAQGNFDLVRGDFAAAALEFQRCIELTQFDSAGLSHCTSMWITSQWGLTEALLGLGRAREGRDQATAALRICKERGITGQALELERALALAEAELGEARAAERLELLIAHQTALGVSGLRLGLTYEARARIATLDADAAAFERYARLTAREYRHGTRSPLAARYERLLNDAARRGLRASAQLSDLERAGASTAQRMVGEEIETLVAHTMASAQRTDERALAALVLICDSLRASSGHLYLSEADRLTLSASYRAAPADANFTERVCDFLTASRVRSQATDDVLTSELHEQEPLQSQLEFEGQTYELLVLGRDASSLAEVVGVVAVALSRNAAQLQRPGQLLRALATHLLGAGGARA